MKQHFPSHFITKKARKGHLDSFFTHFLSYKRMNTKLFHIFAQTTAKPEAQYAKSECATQHLTP